MLCKKIISCVPYKVKSEAVAKTLAAKEVTEMVPATALRMHESARMYIDADSAAELTV